MGALFDQSVVNSKQLEALAIADSLPYFIVRFVKQPKDVHDTGGDLDLKEIALIQDWIKRITKEYKLDAHLSSLPLTVKILRF